VGGGVLTALPLVARHSNHLPTPCHHRAYRYVVVFKCMFGLTQRESHQVRIRGQQLVGHTREAPLCESACRFGAFTPSLSRSMSRPLRSRHTLHVRSRGLLLVGMVLALLTGVLQTATASAASHAPHRIVIGYAPAGHDAIAAPPGGEAQPPNRRSAPAS
jgi:hypothetical protein